MSPAFQFRPVRRCPVAAAPVSCHIGLAPFGCTRTSNAREGRSDTRMSLEPSGCPMSPRTICLGHVWDCASPQAESWTRSSFCSGTCPSRPQNVILGASSGSAAPSAIVSVSNRVHDGGLPAHGFHSQCCASSTQFQDWRSSAQSLWSGASGEVHLGPEASGSSISSPVVALYHKAR
jgi:hypothetical protein